MFGSALFLAYYFQTVSFLELVLTIICTNIFPTLPASWYSLAVASGQDLTGHEKEQIKFRKGFRVMNPEYH